jgi:hypothetical protein
MLPAAAPHTSPSNANEVSNRIKPEDFLPGILEGTVRAQAKLTITGAPAKDPRACKRQAS